MSDPTLKAAKKLLNKAPHVPTSPSHATSPSYATVERILIPSHRTPTASSPPRYPRE